MSEAIKKYFTQSTFKISKCSQGQVEMQSAPSAKFWGPQRLVEVYREPQQALGLAIVGGKVH